MLGHSGLHGVEDRNAEDLLAPPAGRDAGDDARAIVQAVGAAEPPLTSRHTLDDNRRLFTDHDTHFTDSADLTFCVSSTISFTPSTLSAPCGRSWMAGRLADACSESLWPGPTKNGRAT